MQPKGEFRFTALVRIAINNRPMMSCFVRFRRMHEATLLSRCNALHVIDVSLWKI